MLTKFLKTSLIIIAFPEITVECVRADRVTENECINKAKDYGSCIANIVVQYGNPPPNDSVGNCKVLLDFPDKEPGQQKCWDKILAFGACIQKSIGTSGQFPSTSAEVQCELQVGLISSFNSDTSAPAAQQKPPLAPPRQPSRPVGK